MRTVSVINQKGGCGKTTIAVNLAAALGELGKQVLLVDMDPQSHASIGLNLSHENIEYSTYDLLRNPRTRIDEIAYRVNDKLDLLPSSPILSAIEQELSGKPAREMRLANKLARGGADYDFIIIDSPPNVGLLTFNALMAAGEIIIPIEPSIFSLHGLYRLRDTLELLEKETKHKVVVHVLVNNIEKRTSFSGEIVDKLEENFPSELMDVTISHSVRYKEAASMGRPIFKMSRCDRLKWEFLTLARELEEKTSVLQMADIEDWMVRLHGPRIIEEGVLFAVDAPNAETVYITGEFTNWSREGVRMIRDVKDGLWKITLHLDPGEYEYRFIVDGVWIKDPNNMDSVLNEFGQENSLLIV